MAMKTNRELRSAVAMSSQLSIATSRMWWVWNNGAGLILNTGRRTPHSTLVCRVMGTTIYRFRIIDGWYATDRTRIGA